MFKTVIADSNDDVGSLFDWYFNGDHAPPGEWTPCARRCGSRGVVDWSEWGQHRRDGRRHLDITTAGRQATGRRSRVVVSP